MVHVEASSLSAVKLAAAKREGRFFAGRVYGTAKQARDARGAVAPRGPRSGSRASNTSASPTAGWKSSVVVFEHKIQLLAAGGGVTATIFGPATTHNVAGIQGIPDVKIQGVRVEVLCPFDTGKMRWAAGLATAVSAGRKTTAQIMTLAGAVGGHDSAAIDQWYTVGLSNLPVLMKSGLTPAPTLSLVLDVENEIRAEKTEEVTIKVHFTILKPDSVTNNHVL